VEWRRGEITVAVLGQLDNPVDIDGWAVLRDALDIVETTSEYQDELQERFEEFLDSFTSEAYDTLEAADDDYEVDLPLTELTELEELATRWGVPSPELGSLYRDMAEIQDRRDESEEEQRRRDRRRQNQPTLWDAVESVPHGGASIFDHL